MKGQIIQRLSVVLNALNNISVNGKSNLTNLSGSIAMLEEIATVLSSAQFSEPEIADTEK